MKPFLFRVGILAFLFPLVSALNASEQLQLETAIYVFKNSDFHAVDLPGAPSASEHHGILIPSPATIRFDQVALALDGSHYAWNGGDTPPQQFSLIAAPSVPMTAGQPVSLVSSVPSQYLERLADGRLQVREIPAESPDAPHCKLTFAVSAEPGATPRLILACNLDVATVSARENIPGVALEVGKPLIARFKEDLQFPARADPWSALLLKAPNGSDYSLHLLLKLSPAPTQPRQLTKVADYHLKTERFGAAAVADGNYVYVIAGQNSGGILSDIERFDIRTHEITKLTDGLIPRHHLGAAIVGGKIYVLGGQGYRLPEASRFENTVEIYEIESGKITHGAPMPTPRAYFATALWSGKIYAIGGTHGDMLAMGETNRTAIYDPTTNAWTEGLPMPTARATKAVVTPDGIVVIGGYRGPAVSVGLKTVECFVPSKNQWFSLPDLDRPVGADSAAGLENFVFLFGNFDPADEILAYDLTTHTSRVVTNGFAAASQSTAVALDGLIYVIGGTGGGGQQRTDRNAMDDIQVFALTPTASH